MTNLTALYPDATIWLVGHSLGGALASLLGTTFGLPAVAFEAPGERLAAMRLHLPLPPADDSPAIQQGRGSEGYYGSAPSDAQNSPVTVPPSSYPIEVKVLFDLEQEQEEQLGQSQGLGPGRASLERSDSTNNPFRYRQTQPGLERGMMSNSQVSLPPPY